MKAFAALGTYGMSAVTAITAQNTMTGIATACPIPPDVVAAQLDAVADDIGVDAVKIGMVSSEDIITVVAERVKKWKVPLIVDPETIAGDALIHLLLPSATVVTLDAHEAAEIAGLPVATLADAEFHYMRSQRILSMSDYGSGATFSACIAAGLARGDDVPQAVAQAKRIASDAVRFGLGVGKGHSPVDPLAGLYREAEKISILGNVVEAVRFLEEHPVLTRLCPESQINVAMGLPQPQDPSEICGVPGRGG